MTIDDALAGLGAIQPGSGLDGLEQRVLTRIADRRAGTVSHASLAGVALLALVLGVASNALPERAQASSAPFGMTTALAPSTLLLDAQ
ncbi:hypothetical protein SAMN05192583_2956 [Sphingomonas gellani]|uniref:Uncharacterized protein n=1 Tax=Sphingomonas gellani TaxID=1166340 RepID=A0A1H8H9E2_9SPHN|nr:hypothetical protein [Sphingomonas gellani]SEN52118.1 hypothetical protein SAMN05192583_2956 [Sphingomonas gellani]